MTRASNDGLSLQTLLDNPGRTSGSTRSSFDSSQFAQSECGVTIFDQPGEDDETTALESYSAKYKINPSQERRGLPLALKSRLDTRDSRRTSWINVEGWSPGLIDDLTDRFLENHGCLGIEDLDSQTLGGPISRKDGSFFIWVQAPIWYATHPDARWSDMRQCRLRLVICLPTASTAGTIITNFLAQPKTAEKVSAAFSRDLLDSHAMGSAALGCAWALAFSILQLMTQQLSVAWKTFDPIDRNRTSTPSTAELKVLLRCVNDLARVDRYISGIAEMSSFFDAVCTFQINQPLLGSAEQSLSENLAKISARSVLESALTKDRLKHAQQMCRTYIQQYESQINIMLSSNTKQIIHKLDRGQQLGDRLAWVGMILAAMTFISTPFVMITGYYGMNVGELSEGGLATTFEFWQASLPVMAISIGLTVVVVLKLAMKVWRESLSEMRGRYDDG